MELRELKRMLSSESENDLNDDDDEHLPNRDASDIFLKKFLTKHGWDFIMMYKKGLTSENKRATNFYQQREHPIRGKLQQENKQSNNMLFIDDYAPSDMFE